MTNNYRHSTDKDMGTLSVKSIIILPLFSDILLLSVRSSKVKFNDR